MAANCDVVVAGGGPAGIGAAVAAARAGAKVLLIEATNRLGGMATNGLVPLLRCAGDEGGIIKEWRDRLASLNAVHFNDPGPGKPGWARGSFWLDPNVAAIVATEMAVESGARVLFHTFAEGVEMQGRRLAGVWLAHKGGRELAEARVAIDSTGDGDLAAWAGAPFDKGRSGDGKLQDVSLNFQLVGVEMDRRPDDAEFGRLTAVAIQSGELEMPPFVKSLWQGGRNVLGPPGTVHVQYDIAEGVDGSDAESLSQGEIVCHRRVLKIWRFLRANVPGYEKCVISDVAALLGVRETRRIRGLACLTEEDVLQARKHPDGICRGGWYMDVHDGHKPRTLEQRTALAPPGRDFYEIPYGCLVPLEVENLLVAGRCISSTRLANGAMRLQPTCMNTGQAAGTAAALCAKSGLLPRDIRGEELRKTLIGQGMEL